MTRHLPWSLCVAVLCAAALVPVSGKAPAPRRNVIVFVADGLRHGSVNAKDTPALWTVRTRGVHFENSHSVFPTFTLANASAIATGHYLGDTGVFSNTIRPGFAMFDKGNFNLVAGTPVPFMENDEVLADIDDHFQGSFLGSDTFLAMARAHGYRTAAIGKLGPAAMQDVAAIAPQNRAFPSSLPGIIVDDDTGTRAGLPLPKDLAERMLAAGVPPAAPTRTNGYEPSSPYSNGFSGGTLAPNTTQQGWFIDMATEWVLPSLTTDTSAPFAMVFWSRDPDGTQHNNGDSLGKLDPGINGVTSVAGVRNADRALQRLLAWLDAHPAIKANTDVFVTSDHGFATISRSEIDAARHLTTAQSAQHDYLSPAGAIDTLKGTLPNGFLALDLAYDLQLQVYDPDVHPAGSLLFRRLHIGTSGAKTPVETWQHPIFGNALLSTDTPRPDGSDARVIVAANGGSDLVYVPDGDKTMLQRVVDRLMTYDYVSGVFVDDRFGAIPGTLPMSAINLEGSTKMPHPSLVVGFKVFYRDPADLQTGIQISDTSLKEGQGMHGGFGRESTFNNMAAMGPDFKSAFADAAPASNADITPTLLHVIGADMARGPLTGRVLAESLVHGGTVAAPGTKYLRSAPVNGKQTVIVYQEHDGIRYLDRGCQADQSTPDAEVCR